MMIKRICSCFLLAFLTACTTPVKRSVSGVGEANREFPTGTAENAYQELMTDELGTVANAKHMSRLYYHGQKTAKAILILHGLGESPYYTKTLSEYFYNQGYNVFSYLLPGHQRIDPNRINQVTALDWIRGVEKAFAFTRQLGDKTEVLGYSLGGSLGTYLALKYSDFIQKLYLIAPALKISQRVYLTSTMIAWTGWDSTKFCTPYDSQSWSCAILSYGDEQIRIMNDEGLINSPSAGAQVQELITYMNHVFPPADASQDKDQMLLGTYMRLRLPIVMVNSEADDVVDTKFLQKFADSYKLTQRFLTYAKADQIKHIFVDKGSLDRFPHANPGYNTKFDLILDLISSSNQ